MHEYEEDINENELVDNNTDLKSPFSTKDIKITNAIVLLPSLINRLKYDEIVNPDFQRRKK